MGLLTRLTACCLLFIAPLYAQGDELAAKSRRGKELMAAGRFQEAVPVYRELAHSLPNEPGPLMNLGLALHMAGREREAIREFQAVLKLQPTHLPAQLFLGTAYLSLRKPAKALEPLRAVLRAQPDHRDALEMLGRACLSLGRFEEAAKRFARLSELSPQSPKAWNGLGLSYESLAGRSFEELEKVALGSPYWLVLLADSRLRGGEYRGAFFFYREALAKAPSIRGIHTAVAEIYRRTGHESWAAIEEEKERNLPPLDCTGKRAHGCPDARGLTPDAGGPACLAQELECEYQAGRYRELTALARGSKTVESLYWRTRAYNELARQAFSRLAQLPPSAEVHELIAKIHVNRRRYPEAVKEWRKALEFSPGNSFYRKELGICLARTGDHDGAWPILDELLKRSPDSPELNYWVGYMLLGSRRPEEAVSFLKKSVEGDPTVLLAHRDLARAYLQIGQVEKAAPHLRAALPMDEEGTLYYQLAQAYRKTGQRALEREMLKKFRQIQSSAATEKRSLEQKVEITPPL